MKVTIVVWRSQPTCNRVGAGSAVPVRSRRPPRFGLQHASRYDLPSNLPIPRGPMNKTLRQAAFICALSLPSVASAQQPSLPSIKQQAATEIDKLQTLTQQMVDQIFSFSELGFQEFETSRYVTDILEKNGFQVDRGIAGIPTAWVATYGSGKPVIAYITDLDCIPRASQKPGVAYHDPLVEGAPGHGEGHNSGMAVNVTAALVLRQLMTEHHLSGTIKLFPGVAEELLGSKAFYVRAGLFKRC